MDPQILGGDWIDNRRATRADNRLNACDGLSPPLVKVLRFSALLQEFGGNEVTHRGCVSSPGSGKVLIDDASCDINPVSTKSRRRGGVCNVRSRRA
ncbi:protein of unknown function [Micropruina glycogenica]|uniref:Uncharacterized protein n=1 Tax=Micropruina glycogenica TaxID=75385 RepID=A0A2N9JE84_9ACTN|nr:protein of unknown function [Micropruina glycogenica]